ncbi:MAG: LacI family DNA-binding transcriptional regulator [Oscillospiraceae bacterium]|nr:LacI family DNA-binding transcriptional regulator [Oscillospiraceae bacterium]
MSKLTIRDIAKMAGVSTTAVSFVLNNKSGVSDATREKVQKIIESTGFTPNVHTRRLNLGKSYTIHVVLRQYSNSLFNQFALETLSGIFTESKFLGYSIVFTFVDDHMDCHQILDSVRGKDCDGIILNQIADPTLLSILQQEEIPFVCVDAHIPKDGSLPLVEVDYYDAAYQATRHLYDCGHRQIGFIGPQTPAEYYMSTFNGYTAALKDMELVCNPNWLAEVPFADADNPTSLEPLFSKPQLPTAFVCAGDIFAISAVRCAKAKGICIPEDISIMSLDDLLVSQYMDPSLSTMTFPKELLGKKAMQLLYKIIMEEPYTPVNLIKTTPILRESVKSI